MNKRLIVGAVLLVLFLFVFGCAKEAAPAAESAEDISADIDEEISALDTLSEDFDISELDTLEQDLAELESLEFE